MAPVARRGSRRDGQLDCCLRLVLLTDKRWETDGVQQGLLFPKGHDRRLSARRSTAPSREAI